MKHAILLTIMSDTIHLRPRYCRTCTDPGVERAEANYTWANLDWTIPLDQMALVLVDVWAWAAAADAHERTDRVTREKIVPVVEAARQRGLTIIHAPAWPVAIKHPNWVALLGGEVQTEAIHPVPGMQQPAPAYPDSPKWPPQEFVDRTGEYAQYARPHEPQADEDVEHREQKRCFHPEVQPAEDEPVIMDGEELHRLCAQRGILHLVYAGFHTNMCMTWRDYAAFFMTYFRRYSCLVLRDCTTGLETHETRHDMACTRGTIATMEQDNINTLTGDEFIAALREG